MTRKRYYYFKFDNGEGRMLQEHEAYDYATANRLKIVDNPPAEIRRNMSFSTYKNRYCGYNPGLGEYVKGQKHYNQLLKEKGLVEVGTQKLGKQEKDISTSLSREACKELSSHGVSDRTIDHVKD